MQERKEQAKMFGKELLRNVEKYNIRKGKSIQHSETDSDDE